MKNFWKNLKKPFFALAPMYDVTDSAFRQVIAKYGKPDVFFTEFVSADGLASDKGREKLKRELYFTKAERPIVAQIFGAKPATIKIAAEIVAEMGFDGLDINMGCPDRAVIKQGAGTALIKNPKLAVAIIQAAKEGAPNLPISVKTRIGYSGIDELENWTKTLLKAMPTAITFHLRTMKEMSLVPAHWDLIKIPVALAKGMGTLIIGNGDVDSIKDGLAKAKEYSVDGIMIGREILGNPWLFANLAQAKLGCQIEHPVPNPGQDAGTNSPSLISRSACPSDLLGLGWSGRKDISLKEKLQILVEHAKLFEKLYGQTLTNKKLFGGHTKNFAVMKKHFKVYVSGFAGATDLRAKLMESSNAQEVETIVVNFLNN